MVSATLSLRNTASPGKADVEVDRQGLPHVPLALVDADRGLDAQVADDNGVHDRPDYRIRAMQTR